jgi:hypothetical protein
MGRGFGRQVVKAQQPRHIDDAVIHRAALGAPGDGREEFVEQRRGVGQPV